MCNDLEHDEFDPLDNDELYWDDHYDQHDPIDEDIEATK